MCNCIFGYGSLISPLSMVGRYIDYDNIDERYNKNKLLTDYHNRSKTIKCLNRLKSEGMDMHFATIKGYKRYYSIRHRDGGMLEIYPDEYSHKQETVGSVNGTLFTNVPDDVYESVSSSERRYEEREVNLSQFDYSHTEPRSMDEKTTIYVAISGRNKNVDKHPVYHSGILRSYVYLLRDEPEIPNEKIKNHLLEYIKTTYQYDGNKWKTLYELNGREDFERVVDVALGKSDIY